MSARWSGFRSVVADQVQRYLAAKRAVGCKFVNEDRALRLLDSYLVAMGIETIDAIDNDLVERFLASRGRDNARSYNGLLSHVRRFFEWMVDQQIIATSPVRLRARRETARKSPALLTSEDIRRLLSEAAQLADNPRAPLRGPTFETIFALIAGLGLRISEAANLRCCDVDLVQDVLEIRETKFGKDRLVPIGPRLHSRLAGYMELRATRGLPSVGEAPLFSWNGRTPVSTNTIRNVFREKLLPRLQVATVPGTFGPCVHGLRHAFAVRTLTRWYRQGDEPAARLNHLSTILGHVNPNSTAVYLTITAELFEEASRRFEKSAPVFSRSEQ